MNKEIYFRGLKKGEIRELGVIYLLIERPYLQKEIQIKFEKIIGEKINDQTLSNTLKGLEKRKIIKREPIKKKGKGANPNLVSIPKNHYTLVNLINYLYSYGDIPLLLRIKTRFIYSRYSKDLIILPMVRKTELILENMLKRYGNIDFAFEDEERQLILKILQNSPSALHYTVNWNYKDLIGILDFKRSTLKSLDDNDLRSMLKDQFIFKLQTYLGEDILKMGSYDPIEYTISAEFLQVMENELAKNYTKCIHLLSPEIEGNIIKRTIRTRMKFPD